MLEITDETDCGIAICRLRGRLDSAASSQADEHLIALAAQKVADLVLDFSELEYMSSAGLRVLLMAAKRAKKGSVRLMLAGPQEGVKQVLDISGFASILEIHPTREEALRAMVS